MTAYLDAMRQVYAPPALPVIWHCHPDRVHCPAGHALLFHKAGFSSRQRLDGHVWHGCQVCTPTTFFFGNVRGSGGDPYVMFYRIDKRLFDFWMNEGRDIELVDGTLEQLYLIGHNPFYRPMKRESAAHTATIDELRRLGYFNIISLTP